MVRPYFKLCGLHSEDDVELASFSQADFIGFVFAESKRKVDPIEAASWLKRHELPGKKVAALFVNAPLNEVKKTVSIVDPDIIQLHGAESPEEARLLKRTLNKEVWKALPHDEQTLSRMMEYIEVIDGFIIDAKVKGAWGGTGKKFDWTHVPQYVNLGREHDIPVLIAGGINPQNVNYVLPYQPWGIDLSSGVEKNGKKDKQLLSDLEKRLHING